MPVVLIGGILQDRREWDEAGYVARLERDNIVILMDPLGHGQSSKPIEPHQYTYEAVARHTAAVVKHAGFGAAHLIGFSRGGWIAGWTAYLSPAIVLSCAIGSQTLSAASSKSIELGLSRAAALRSGDWDTYFASLPVQVDQERRERYANTNSPHAIAAATLGARLHHFGVPPLSVRTLRFVGSDESSMGDIATEAATRAELFAVLTGLDHYDVFDAGRLICGLTAALRVSGSPVGGRQ